MTGGVVWLAPDGRTTVLPPSWEPLSGHRSDEAWTWRTIDKTTGAVTGQLDGVEGGSLRLNVFADTRGTGSLSWSGPVEDMPVWRDLRVQPVYTATLLGGSSVSWPMGVYLCTTPSVAVEDGWATADVALFDHTLVLRRARLRKASGVLAGTPIIAHVRAIIEAQAPSVRHTIEDGAATLRSSMTWDAGTSWATICNALLDAGGYFGLWADADGALRSSPYVRPQDRPYVWDFARGANAVHAAGMERVKDEFDVPNRVTLISRGDGNLAAMRADAVLDDIDPTHPLAGRNLGTPTDPVWIDRVEDDVEAADLTVLQGMADRLLREGLSVASTVRVEHAPIPLALQDRVAVHTSGLVVPSATVQAIDIPCTAGEDWSTIVREVAL